MRFFLAILSIVIYSSFLHATEPSFKFTFGSNLGNIPLEINKMSQNKKTIGGLKINSWTLSPNFLSFANNQNNFKASRGIDQKPEIKKIKVQDTEKREYKIKDYVVYPKHGVGQIT